MTMARLAAAVGGSRLRARFVAVRTFAGKLPLSLFLLAIRIGLGMEFFNSGRLELRTWEFTVKLFSDEYRVPLLDPEVAARVAAFCELTFPPLLFIGLATRLATLPLLGMIAVIQIFVYPVEAWVDDLLWGGCLLFIASRGAGVFSMDFLIENWIKTGRFWRRGETIAREHAEA
jgi:putative oxidoreductase